MSDSALRSSRKRWVVGILVVVLIVALLIHRTGPKPPVAPAPPDTAPPGATQPPVASTQARETAPAAALGPGDPAPFRAPSPPFDAPTAAPRRAAELIEHGVGDGSWPPGADAQGRPHEPSPFNDAIRGLAREISLESGPEAYEQALLLLRAEREGAGLIGAAVLATQAPWVWDEALVREIAAHADPAVPLLALQDLLDAGRSQPAEALRELLLERFGETPGWATLPLRQALPGSALRGLLDLSRSLNTDGSAPVELIAAVHTLDTADYSARMAALLALREHLTFEAFRDAVRNEYGVTDPGQPDVWRMGLERLVEQLEGPVEFHASDPVFTVTDVQVRTAREYPTQFEDLALHLEGLLRHPDAQFGTGVTQALLQEVERARQFPLSDAEAAALRRIEVLAGHVVESDVSALVPPPPAS